LNRWGKLRVMFRNTLTAFAMVFPAELPDKSMFATLVLTSRFRRPAVVWCGVVAAFAMHVTVAVSAGSLISRLPERLVGGVTALLFSVGSVLLWRGSGDSDQLERTEGALEDPDRANHERFVPTNLRLIVVTSFITVGLAEWGDLTQLATASLAADRGDPFSVGIGAFAVLVSVAALAAFLGGWIVKTVPLGVVRKTASLLFAGLAIWTIFEQF
jgi:Ca2+/H+ antiporter, TMEM165/GDT1 family